jgi:uncharacterized protein YciI
MSDPVVHQVLFYDYVVNAVERRAPYRAGHLELVGKWKAEGRLVSGGALGQPPTGAMLVFLVDDPAEVEAFVTQDPYVSGGIVTAHRVVPWTVVTG